MGPRRWFGTDGIRGRVGKAPMTPEFVAAAGAAAGKFFAKGKSGGTVLVARDTRGSGPELEAALAAGLELAGLKVLRVGVMPSGAAAMIVPEMGACGGVILSASHNPAEDNGLKFCRMWRRSRSRRSSIWNTRRSARPRPEMRILPASRRHWTRTAIN